MFINLHNTFKLGLSLTFLLKKKMEAEAKTNQVEPNLDKINIFCQNILKYDAKLRYYEEKLSSLKYKINKVNQKTKHQQYQHLEIQDLQRLQLHGLNLQSIIYLPQFKLIIMLLINLFIITLTLTHWIFLPVIESFQNIISVYIYISLFFGIVFGRSMFPCKTCNPQF